MSLFLARAAHTMQGLEGRLRGPIIKADEAYPNDAAPPADADIAQGDEAAAEEVYMVVAEPVLQAQSLHDNVLIKINIFLKINNFKRFILT